MLSQAEVDRLKAPSTGKDRTWALNVTGYQVTVYSTGTKSCYLEYSANNNRRKLAMIGDAAVLTFDEALEQALDSKRELLAGSDPATYAPGTWRIRVFTQSRLLWDNCSTIQQPAAFDPEQTLAI